MQSQSQKQNKDLQRRHLGKMEMAEREEEFDAKVGPFLQNR